MMWNSETPSWQDVVQVLRDASEAEQSVRLGEEVSDEEMDGWGVPVPEPIREICRRAGALQVGGHGEFGPSYRAPGVGEGAAWRCGDPGSFRIVHTNASAETYYVDVDPATGAWGPVFRFWENHGAELVAPSLPHWLVSVAGLVRCAARDEEHFGDFSTAFLNWFSGDFADAGDEFPEDAPEALARAAEPATAGPVTVREARASGDPVLADAGSRLPEGALLADLRGATGPTAVPFGRHPGWPGGTPVYRRFHGGAILAAVGQT
ncbi:hypothetical protein ACGFMM_00025 [Streptomyces sp. NPDC048604]|uniref:hypothetical protein n=1 Tax=Streptomyces sp. NPDC048604 TaxID=3365578 RepID=UPI00371B7516